MAEKFKGKVAVITGGSTGMGLATAKRFVREGMDQVFITGRRKDALDRAAAEIGKNVTAVQGDVANLADLDRLVDEIRNPETPRCRVRSDYVLALPCETEPLAPHPQTVRSICREGQMFSEFPRSPGFDGHMA
jgi:NAD(P)-dependent dehydrogenase (short-subunit alcohol dehydrogenase family)